MTLDQLNIHNLTALWHKYGAAQREQRHNSRLVTSNNWPYRSWVEGEPDAALQQAHTPATHTLSSWPHPLPNRGSLALERAAAPPSNTHWQWGFEQTAMYLPLNNLALPAEHQHNKVKLYKVDNNQSLLQWIQVNSDAFGYKINAAVFSPLLADQEIAIYLGFVNQQPALGALLYKTGKVTGLHQMGIKPEFQGLGLATNAMSQLLAIAQQQGAKHLVLQASSAGLPLYTKLGFQPQFRLLHFYYSNNVTATTEE